MEYLSITWNIPSEAEPPAKGKAKSMLKSGTSDSRKAWFNVGEYKKLPNKAGGIETCPPERMHTRQPWITLKSSID